MDLRCRPFANRNTLSQTNKPKVSSLSLRWCRGSYSNLLESIGFDFCEVYSLCLVEDVRLTHWSGIQAFKRRSFSVSLLFLRTISLCVKTVPALQSSEKNLCLKLMRLLTLAFFANRLHKNRTKTAPKPHHFSRLIWVFRCYFLPTAWSLFNRSQVEQRNWLLSFFIFLGLFK